MSNTSLYVLNGAMQKVPFGVTGELYIGGVQLARGYLNRDELTEETFRTLSINGESRRLYRTGDKARYLPDGQLVFMGRVDDQVKVLQLFVDDFGQVLAQRAIVDVRKNQIHRATGRFLLTIGVVHKQGR